MRILLVGAGSIGGTVARAAETMPNVEAVLAFDVQRDVATALADALPKTEAVATFEEGLTRADVVVEAASQEAVALFGPRALEAGKDLVVVSVGALVDDALRATLGDAARGQNRRVFVPTGAIAGLDGLRAAREGGLTAVTLTTAKPPAGLGVKAPLDKPQTLFEGTARDAVRQFPKNVNVAAALSLAGVGFDETRVRIVADPALDLNTHSIDAAGAFGRLHVRVENRPFPEHPATSHLAALSVIALLRRLADPFQLGS